MILRREGEGGIRLTKVSLISPVHDDFGYISSNRLGIRLFFCHESNRTTIMELWWYLLILAREILSGVERNKFFPIMCICIKNTKKGEIIFFFFKKELILSNKFLKFLSRGKNLNHN